MRSLRWSFSWLIIIFGTVIYVNCELEEYFKWKQITFASVANGKFYTKKNVFYFQQVFLFVSFINYNYSIISPNLFFYSSITFLNAFCDACYDMAKVLRISNKQ